VELWRGLRAALNPQQSINEAPQQSTRNSNQLISISLLICLSSFDWICCGREAEMNKYFNSTEIY